MGARMEASRAFMRHSNNLVLTFLFDSLQATFTKLHEINLTLKNAPKMCVDSPPLLIAEIPRWKSSKLMTPSPLGSKNLVRSFT